MTIEDAVERLHRVQELVTAAKVDLYSVGQGQAPPVEVEPPWMLSARGELAAGVKEIPGPRRSERIQEYRETCSKANGGNLGAWAMRQDDGDLAWCSLYVHWCLLRCGIEGTHSAGARSFAGWGVPALAVPGAIAVLERKGGGHVAFVERSAADGLYLLGGNQDDSVSIKRYPRSKVIAYRWPEGVPQ